MYGAKQNRNKIYKTLKYLIMIHINKIAVAILGATSLLIASCNKNDNPPADTFDTSGTFTQNDQMARPAINTVFNAAADKNTFNTTIPSAMGAIFQPKFLTNLVALDAALGTANPAYTHYTTNALGWSPTTLTTNLATDVLNVSTTGATSLGTLTGRKLDDDVIDIELKYLIFGGPTSLSNPQLISDHVDNNDKAFLSTFPYEAAPWQ
jgi:hypothetical protein